MRKIIFILLALIPYYAQSCDFCNGYLGLNPHFKKNSVSLRNQSRFFQGTEMSAAELEGMGLSKKDFFETRINYELFAQYYPTQKLQLILSVPYVVNRDGMSDKAADAMGMVHHNLNHESKETTNTYQGIGDVVLVSHYQVFNINAAEENKVGQRLMVGPGIKLPTGICDVPEGSESHTFVHQPGTGSWDPMISMIYLAKYKRSGLMANLSYMVTTKNKQNFRSGNKLNTNVTGFYQITSKRFNIYPNIGFYWEHAATDIYLSEKQGNSGGNISYLHNGIDIYYKRFALNAAFQLPILKALNGNQAEICFKVLTGFSFTFN